MSVNYMIHCPVIDDDDSTIYTWYIEIRFQDNITDDYTNYGTVQDMLDWCYRHMEHTPGIVRLSIWCNNKWWGEVEQY